jgi:hypothetical protein
MLAVGCSLSIGMGLRCRTECFLAVRDYFLARAMHSVDREPQVPPTVLFEHVKCQNWANSADSSYVPPQIGRRIGMRPGSRANHSDERGEKVSIESLPRTVADMPDDPYQHEIRVGGLSPRTREWGDPESVEGFAEMLALAFQIAKTP